MDGADLWDGVEPWLVIVRPSVVAIAAIGAGLWRLTLVAAYVASSIAAVGASGCCVALTECRSRRWPPTLGLTITSQVLDAVPQISAIHPWLPSHYWQQFIDVLRDPMALDKVGHGLLAAATTRCCS